MSGDKTAASTPPAAGSRWIDRAPTVIGVARILPGETAMDETTDDPPDTLGEIDAGELADVDDEVRGLLEELRAETDGSLRLAVRYTADEYEVLFARDDIAKQFSGPELVERVEVLVMKGLGDPPQEATLFDFGDLDATVRFYEHTHVVHFPYRDWSGYVFVLDRQTTPLVDLMDRHLSDG